MQVTEHIHALKIPFAIPVSPEMSVNRDVYALMIFGKTITLIDSGVAGAGSTIFEYIRHCGRDPGEISLLILSHSHPDHLGAARAIIEGTGCTVAAHPGEREWIEDTGRQEEERPVPGFRSLVEGPVKVNVFLEDGEVMDLGKGIQCRVIHTPGHSKGSISLHLECDSALFTADSLPVPGDLPIYEDIAECVYSLRKIKQAGNVETLLSSLEPPISGRDAIKKRIEEGAGYLRKIHEAVLRARAAGKDDLIEMTGRVVKEIGLPPFAANPLVARAFASSLGAEGISFEI